MNLHFNAYTVPSKTFEPLKVVITFYKFRTAAESIYYGTK